jgi:GTP:adenosylcobinamide-phosphate guanylyltransferase
MSTDPSTSYPEPLDAIVLAGTDNNPRRLIQGQNKAFLEIGSQLLVHRVVTALLEARSVEQVFVVGPVKRLRQALGDLQERVTLVEQAGKMLANAWQAIHVSEARYREQHGKDDPSRPLLFISSDLPLISGAAIDDFASRCFTIDSRDNFSCAMLAGVAEEASLSRYLPDENGPGLVRPYVHLADCRVRLANIYIGRPRTLSNQAFLQTGFEHRKAEKWKNVLALSWRFLSQSGGLTSAWTTLRLQATLLASKRQTGLYRWLRARNPVERIENVVGTTLGGKVRMVITPYGGLSLDADNEEDFQVLGQRFDDWKDVDPVRAQESSKGDSV